MKWDHCAYCIQIFWSGSYFYLGPDHLWLRIFSLYHYMEKIYNIKLPEDSEFRWLEKIISFRWSEHNISCWKHALIFLSAVFITTTKNGVTKWRNQLYKTVHIKKFKWLIMMIKLILVIWLWSMSLIIYSHDWKNLESSHFCWGCKLILTDSRQIFRPFQFFR